jgi:hypothetical protein
MSHHITPCIHHTHAHILEREITTVSYLTGHDPKNATVRISSIDKCLYEGYTAGTHKRSEVILAHPLRSLDA